MIQRDKVLHIIAGAFIALVALLIFKSWIPALILATMAGGVKEWRDSKGHGQVELWDFLATAFGGLGGVLIWSIISHWI